MPVVAQHVVDVYRRTADGAGWDLIAEDVQCDLQPAASRSGSVAQQSYGREVKRERGGFFDTGFDLQPDDGVKVKAGPGGLGNWLVSTADDWGAPGDLEAVLEWTGEEFED